MCGWCHGHDDYLAVGATMWCVACWREVQWAFHGLRVLWCVAVQFCGVLYSVGGLSCGLVPWRSRAHVCASILPGSILQGSNRVDCHAQVRVLFALGGNGPDVSKSASWWGWRSLSFL